MTNNKITLDEKLIDLKNENIYPMHMPGHKRNPKFSLPDPYTFDITEIDGFDDLHHPETIIRDLINRYKRAYKSDETFLLPNGSTSGILSAICSICNTGDEIIVAANCHKSVFNAVNLIALTPHIIYPEGIVFEGSDNDIDMCGKICPKTVEDALETFPNSKCVIITSPTYEGIVSDCKAIAQSVHNNGKVLIVDQAHGAHFIWDNFFPEDALISGADIVIESIHKTLPALTQCAIMNVNLTHNNINVNKLKHMVQTFVSSSPSYVLMASMSQCINYMENDSSKDYNDYKKNLLNFYSEASKLEKLQLFQCENMDKSKLIIITSKTDITGYKLADILRNNYKIEVEMSSLNHVTCITSIADEMYGFIRLINALKSIDNSINISTIYNKNNCSYNTITIDENNAFLTDNNNTKMSIYDAYNMPYKSIILNESIAEISSRFIYKYPPGIPCIIPGEIITKEKSDFIINCLNNGEKMYGITKKDNDYYIDIIDLQRKDEP